MEEDEPIVWLVGADRPDTEQLGALLRRLRRRAGLSVQELAAEIGLSVSFIRMVERGERCPAPATAAEWFGAVGTPARVEPTLENGMRPDLEVTDPQEGRMYLLEFKSRVRAQRSDLEQQLRRYLDPVVGTGGFLVAAQGHLEQRVDLAWAPTLVSDDARLAKLGRAVTALSAAPELVLDRVLDLLDPPAGDRYGAGAS